MSRFPIIAVFFVLLIVGSGCPSLPGPASVSQRPPEEEALALVPAPGSTFVLRQTALGLGPLAQTLGGSDGRRTLTVNAYQPGASIALAWTMDVEEETPESLAAREAWNAEAKPIGQAAPPEPKAIYTTVTKTGGLASDDLADGEWLLMPAYWGEGEQVLEDNTLIWLSKKQYEELVATRETHLSAGLLDAKLASLLKLGDAVQNALGTLRQKAAEASTKGEDVTRVHADADWRQYKLKANGSDIRVRTIRASNWFASYEILANSDHPLILKMTPNPLSLGAIDASSPAGILSASLGYEVVEINL